MKSEFATDTMGLVLRLEQRRLPQRIKQLVIYIVTVSLYEAVATPLTYSIVTFLKRKEGIDVYDHETRFNPLLMTD